MIVMHVEIGNDFAGNVIRLGIQQLFFDSAQLHITVHRVIECGAVRLRRLLRHMGNYPLFGNVNVAGVLMHLAAQQRE